AGLFVAPFDPAGRTADDLTILLESTAGTGRSSATLRYAATEPAASTPAPDNGAASIAEKLAYGLLGAALAGLLILVLRRRRGSIADPRHRPTPGPAAQ